MHKNFGILVLGIFVCILSTGCRQVVETYHANLAVKNLDTVPYTNVVVHITLPDPMSGTSSNTLNYNYGTIFSGNSSPYINITAGFRVHENMETCYYIKQLDVEFDRAGTVFKYTVFSDGIWFGGPPSRLSEDETRRLYLPPDANRTLSVTGSIGTIGSD